MMKRQKLYFMTLNQKFEDMDERLRALENKDRSYDDELYKQVDRSLPLQNEDDLQQFEDNLADDRFFSVAVSINIL